MDLSEVFLHFLVYSYILVFISVAQNLHSLLFITFLEITS